MSRVDFYILKQANLDAHNYFACRLIEKGYRHSERIYVHMPDQIAAYQMDELLWTYQNDSFIPHHQCSESSKALSPVHIGYLSMPTDQELDHSMLINLTDTIPEFFHQFERIAHIVQPTEQALMLAREHYRQYRQHGCTLNYHDLRKAATHE